ncbi:MAG: NAD(P)/FAD-dependent oxidoreductase [Desulfobacteraceae bacterium]|nr:MAG: NAD(P)/FAD-dependent oxidoreductase [Desulfobacteraceae bacterium]
MTNNQDRHRIVIVGGGAGGLELATLLGNKLGRRGLADVMLIDANLTHLWKPLLHAVAAGTMDADFDELSYMAQATEHHFTFRLGCMVGLNRGKREIRIAGTYNDAGEEIVPPRTRRFDTLVLAVGSETDDFGIPGVKEHCLFLDSQDQARHFQRYFLERWLSANTHAKPLRKGQLNIAIAGGGATGVELAAELHTATHEMLRYGLNRIPKDQSIEFDIIEAADRLLPGLPEAISEKVHDTLVQLGIKVHTRQMVSEVVPEGFRTKSGLFIPAEIKVWAAGIKSPDWLRNLDGLETNRKNQLVVYKTLQTTCDENIFAFGDCAACAMNGKQVPPRAQAAHQQAKLLVKTMQARLNGKPLPEYRYSDRGSLVNLSFYDASGSLMGGLLGKNNRLIIEGWLARIAYISLYKLHLKTLHGLRWVIRISIVDFLLRRVRPKLKLH